MKQFTLLVLCYFLLFTTTAQIKGAYFSYRGGIAVKDGITKGIGHFSAGLTHNESIGVGAGIGFIQFEQAYFPLTVDICFLGNKDKPGPIVIGSVGYGIYKKTNPYFTTNGGFTGSLNIGAGLPVKKLSKVFMTVGYAIYGFKGSKDLQVAGESYQSIKDIKMVTLTLGIKV